MRSNSWKQTWIIVSDSTLEQPFAIFSWPWWNHLWRNYPRVTLLVSLYLQLTQRTQEQYSYLFYLKRFMTLELNVKETYLAMKNGISFCICGDNNWYLSLLIDIMANKNTSPWVQAHGHTKKHNIVSVEQQHLLMPHLVHETRPELLPVVKTLMNNRNIDIFNVWIRFRWTDKSLSDRYVILISSIYMWCAARFWISHYLVLAWSLECMRINANALFYLNP